MRYVFDLDGTICTLVKDGDYNKAEPIKEMVDLINTLWDEGDYIEIRTARGKTSGINWKAVTRRQLKEWGVSHDNLSFSKPAADFYIDDKAITPQEFLKRFGIEK